MNEIQKSIIERVKEKLNVVEDLNVFQLHDLLFKTRNNSHPDLFDKSNEESAKNKFVELTLLLNELKLFIDNQKLNKTGNELILYQENYENILNKSQIIFLEEEISKLTNNLNMKDYEIKKLNKTIENQRSEEIIQTNNELKELYKPKNSNFVVLGITTFLILAVNILFQVNSLKQGLKDILPFDIRILNSFLFILFIIISLKLIFNNYKLNRVQKISEELKSNYQIRTFYRNYVEWNTRDEETSIYSRKYFTENDAEEFIHKNFFSKGYNFKIKFIDNIIEDILYPNKRKNINYLKDIFLYNLISKNLVDIGNAKSLDRKFWIN